MTVRLLAETVAAIEQHARETHPDECCGMIVRKDEREQVIRVTNVQNLMHERDPEQFPRDARIAFTMGPEAGPILLAAERGEIELRAVYHSHPEHDAYFSEEDKRQAIGAWGEPSYPDAAQIVVSIYGNEVRATKAFLWDGSDFVAAAIAIGDE